MQTAMRRIAGVVTAVLAVLAATLPGTARAHEGHDHGAPPPPVTSTIAPRSDASSNDLELVAIARDGRLLVYLDTFRDNAPVTGATLEIDGPGGTLQASEVEPGVYAVAAPFAAKPGRHDLAFTITAGDVVDVLTGTLTIPEQLPVKPGGEAKPFSWLVDSALAQDLRRRVGERDLSLWAVLGIGFLLGALVARRRGRGRSSAQALALLAGLASAGAAVPRAADAAGPEPVFAARDVAQRFPDGAVFVPKPTQRILAIRTSFTEARTHPRTIELPGRIIADPNAVGLVQASVGGRLAPPEGGFKPLGTRVKAGDVLAYVRPPIGAADLTTLLQQARELDQQISIVSRKLERLRAIQGVVARSQIEDAELELKGLGRRRASLDRMQQEPEPLLAPVDGVIAVANAVAGQMAEPNSIIFQIIEPTRLLVEALSFEPPAAATTAEGLLADGRRIRLAHRGTGLAGRNQAIPIHFAVEGDTGGLRAGQPLTVLATTSESRSGVSLPRAAVLRGANGQSVVYEHTAAERFVPREVRIEPLDAERMLVVAGLEPQRRVVTQGAELLDQFR